MNILDSFKDGSSELNSHSALTFGKLILALLVNLNSALFQSFFALSFVSIGMAGPAVLKCARSFFHSSVNETNKKSAISSKVKLN